MGQAGPDGAQETESDGPGRLITLLETDRNVRVVAEGLGERPPHFAALSLNCPLSVFPGFPLFFLLLIVLIVLIVVALLPSRLSAQFF
jgi:hypothetical protein